MAIRLRRGPGGTKATTQRHPRTHRSPHETSAQPAHAAPGVLQRALAHRRLVAPAELRVLQRVAGNRAVRRLVRSLPSTAPRDVIQRRGPFGPARLPKDMRAALSEYLGTGKTWNPQRKLKELQKMETMADKWLNKWRLFPKKNTRFLVRKLKLWIAGERPDVRDLDPILDGDTQLWAGGSIPGRLDTLIKLGQDIENWKAKHGKRYRKSFGNRAKVEKISDEYGLSPTKIGHAKTLRDEINQVVESQKKKLKLGDKMLDLSVILEVVDVKHQRAGRFLEYAFGKWLKVKTKQNYWDYVTNTLLPTEFPGAEYKVKFMTPEELESKKVTFKDGKIYHGNTPITKPTGGGGKSSYNKVIYAMDGSYTFYAMGETEETATSQKERYHHSSFFSGQAVRAAGTMEVDSQAKLEGLTPESGHYQPGPVQMIHAVIGLLKNKVNLSGITIVPAIKQGAVPAKRVRARLRKEQANGWKTEPKGFDQVHSLTGLRFSPKDYSKFIRNKIEVP